MTSYPCHERMCVKVLASVGMASLFVSLAVSPAWSQNSDMVQTGSDIPAKWQKPETDYDYVKREMMIPMRDGVKLHTIIVIPKGAHNLPMLLERTPYDANFFTPTDSPHLKDAVWAANRNLSTTATSSSIRIFVGSTAPRATM